MLGVPIFEYRYTSIYKSMNQKWPLHTVMQLWTGQSRVVRWCRRLAYYLFTHSLTSFLFLSEVTRRRKENKSKETKLQEEEDQDSPKEEDAA